MMNNQAVVLLIAIGILIVVLLVVPSSENFGETVPYIHPYTAASSVNCEENPGAPACKPPPTPSPIAKGIQSCAPSDGQWSVPGGDGGRSKLVSPCCQPPRYELGQEKPYKTCDDRLDSSNPIETCVANCCANAKNEANNYDPSWYPMARCACSMWCYNQDVPHFRKYGTAVHYITGDIAEAQTGDQPDFIGSGSDFAGK